MRQVLNGLGLDNTAAAQAWLQATVNPLIKDLIIIGRPEDPRSLWITNHDRPLVYSPYGFFHPAVVTRDVVTATIGLEAQEPGYQLVPG